MAMKFNKHDANVTLAVARCGTMTYQNLKDLGYSDSRIKNRSCGEEKTLNYIGRDCNTGEKLYQLTDVGKDYAQRLGLDRNEQYRAQGHTKTMNFEHDRKLSSIYCSLSQEERDMWKTEEQYKREIEEVREHIRQTDPERWEEIKDTKMTAFDGGYVDAQGQEHYVEVITQNYKGEMTESKEASAGMLGGNYCSYDA